MSLPRSRVPEPVRMSPHYRQGKRLLTSFQQPGMLPCFWARKPQFLLSFFTGLIFRQLLILVHSFFEVLWVEALPILERVCAGITFPFLVREWHPEFCIVISTQMYFSICPRWIALYRKNLRFLKMILNASPFLKCSCSLSVSYSNKPFLFSVIHIIN